MEALKKEIQNYTKVSINFKLQSVSVSIVCLKLTYSSTRSIKLFTIQYYWYQSEISTLYVQCER